MQHLAALLDKTLTELDTLTAPFLALQGDIVREGLEVRLGLQLVQSPDHYMGLFIRQCSASALGALPTA